MQCGHSSSDVSEHWYDDGLKFLSVHVVSEILLIKQVFQTEVMIAVGREDCPLSLDCIG